MQLGEVETGRQSVRHGKSPPILLASLTDTYSPTDSLFRILCARPGDRRSRLDAQEQCVPPWPSAPRRFHCRAHTSVLPPSPTEYDKKRHENNGSFGTYARAHTDFLVRMPDEMSFEEASAVAFQSLVAFQVSQLGRLLVDLPGSLPRD